MHQLTSPSILFFTSHISLRHLSFLSRLAELFQFSKICIKSIIQIMHVGKNLSNDYVSTYERNSRENICLVIAFPPRKVGKTLI